MKLLLEIDYDHEYSVMEYIWHFCDNNGLKSFRKNGWSSYQYFPETDEVKGFGRRFIGGKSGITFNFP